MEEVRQEYNQDLQKVREDILDMGQLVVQALHDAITALKNRDEELAAQVIFRDKEIDLKQIVIEDKTVELIALQQPVATDLRVLSTALKMTTDLERIGDHAKKIAKVANALGQKELFKPLIDLPKAADYAAMMVEKALQSYVHLDAKMAQEVISLDEHVDELCDQCKRDILTYMIDDNSNIPQGLALNKIVSRVERIGDHATNLGEWVFYLVTGEKIQKTEVQKHE